MKRPTGSILSWMLVGIGLGLAGCREPEPEPLPWQIDPASLRPVKGTVRLNGAPLKHAVVSFYGESGVPSVGETSDDGAYELETMEKPGIPPGRYKVGVSYYLSPDGAPQGLSARSAMMPSKAMLAARETLPPEYSDMNRTTLSAEVGPNGGTHDFDLRANPVPPPAPAAAEPTPAPSAPAAAKDEAPK